MKRRAAEKPPRKSAGSAETLFWPRVEDEAEERIAVVALRFARYEGRTMLCPKR